MPKFFNLLLLVCIFSSLSGAEVWQNEAVTAPVFQYDFKTLQKPSVMNPAPWVDALETERDKADYLGKIEPFEYLTKEISTTLNGKYGKPEISTIKLIYSVLRTRHKFSGKRNMATDFYGITDVSDTAITIIAIDTIAAKAMNDKDETFENQWAAVNEKNPASAEFIDAVERYTLYGDETPSKTMEVEIAKIEEKCLETHEANPLPENFRDVVKRYAQMPKKKNLPPAFEEQLENFIKTNSSMINLAKQIFDIFAPINGDIPFSGEYKGWTIRSESTIERLIILPAAHEDKERLLNQQIIDLANKGITPEIYCRSAIADIASEKLASRDDSHHTVILEYMYDPLANIIFPHAGIAKEDGIMRVFFTREVDRDLEEILRRPYAKIPQSKLSEIYTATMNEAIKRTMDGFSLEDITFLLDSGNAQMFRHLSVWLFQGKHGFEKDISRAVKCCRNAVDLGDKQAKQNLPEMLWQLCLELIGTDAKQSIELCKEAASLGHQMALLTAVQIELPPTTP